MVFINSFTQAIQEIRARSSQSQGRRDPGYWYLKTGIIVGLLWICYFDVSVSVGSPKWLGSLIVTSSSRSGLASRLALDFIPENLYLGFAGYIFALLMKEIFMAYQAFQLCIRSNIEECAIPFKLLGFLAEQLCFGDKGSSCFTIVLNTQFPLYALLAYWLDIWVKNILFGRTDGPPPPPRQDPSPPSPFAITVSIILVIINLWLMCWLVLDLLVAGFY